MGTESLNLRGGLTGGFAVAAGLLWMAALAGFGSGIGAPPPADAPLPPLPVLPPQAASPMESPASFAAVTAQPVFAEDRQPHPFRLNPQTGNEGGTLRLTGVLLAGEFAMATLSNSQNRSIRLRLNGDTVDGWQLLALEPRRATVMGPQGAQVLELAVFNGQGGEPPTQLGTAAARPAVGARPPVAPPPAPSLAAQPATGTARGSGSSSAAPAASPSPPSNGPSEEQMAAIRERIRARRAQLQQQQQHQSPPPPGGAANR